MLKHKVQTAMDMPMHRTYCINWLLHNMQRVCKLCHHSMLQSKVSRVYILCISASSRGKYMLPATSQEHVYMQQTRCSSAKKQGRTFFSTMAGEKALVSAMGASKFR